MKDMELFRRKKKMDILEEAERIVDEVIGTKKVKCPECGSLNVRSLNPLGSFNTWRNKRVFQQYYCHNCKRYFYA
jgi:transposase-like protein